MLCTNETIEFLGFYVYLSLGVLVQLVLQGTLVVCLTENER